MVKDHIRNLAIFGGTPTVEQPLHVNQPYVADREDFRRRVEGVLDSGWLTNDGPLVLELESRLARLLKVEHCVAVCNGTQGLELVLRGLDLSGEVILPAFTFAATAHAVQWLGLRPVFCDIDRETWTLDPARCETLVNEKTAAILGVHLFGRPCATRRLAAVASRHGLRLVFDAAHAFGCSQAGTTVGGFGDAKVFSFHATKVFQTFEGGAITTNDAALA
jgi:dTDP-4-amino-4,6-dideoxygalactose transaminase